MECRVVGGIFRISAAPMYPGVQEMIEKYQARARQEGTDPLGYGMHFLSDVLVGAGVGMLSGLLVPHAHLTKKGKPDRLTIVPVGLNGPGLLAVYKF